MPPPRAPADPSAPPRRKGPPGRGGMERSVHVRDDGADAQRSAVFDRRAGWCTFSPTSRAVAAAAIATSLSEDLLLKHDRRFLGGEAGLRRLGHWAVLLVSLVAGACSQAPRPGVPYPAFQQYEGWRVDRLGFVGETLLPQDSLRAAILTHAPRCVVPVLPRRLCPGFARQNFQLDLTELARDVARLQLYYRDFGYYGTRVVPTVEPLQPRRVEVRFTIAPGERVFLRELEIEGVDEVADTARLRRILPLQEGDPFRRSGFLASADTIRNALVRRGHAYADVLRNYSLDTIFNVAEAQYVGIPGPLVLLDTVVVVGNYRLSAEAVQRMLGLRRGQVINLFELTQSQRYLYGLDIVRFASVQLPPAPEDMEADTAGTAVVVRIVEAPRYAVNTAVGYGTIDCLRGDATIVDRNFLGGARSLEIGGAVSKVGVGHPLGWGLENSACRALSDDPYSDTLNYRASALFRQPRLFGTANELQLGLFANRQSQYRVYLRESVGGNLAVTRELGRAARGTATVDVERGFTRSNPIFFCVIFGACTVETREELVRPRWSNSLGASVLVDRSSQAGILQTGHQLRGSVDWASQLLGSDDLYLRLLGQAAVYRPIFRPGWILSGRLQAGGFIDPGQGFIPPQRRFYAGGSTTVRGYEQNRLGTIAYVRRIDAPATDTTPTTYVSPPEPQPIGGTRVVVASAELRTPAPWFRDFMRLAYFVDAGQVWAPETDIELLSPGAIRVTPGVGLRFQTPVGPIRFDVGFNPYDQTPGPLFREEPDGTLSLEEPDYSPGRRTFWQRLVFHLAVGQAF
jgi:outer membrane protein insertion porin family